MKEYKLSAKSKYSVCYLLCGLFMFFFMFAILNLSSYAEPNSKLIVKTGNGGVGGSCTVKVSNDIRINYTIGINDVVHMTNSLYVTTSEGTYLLYSSSFSKAYGTYTESMGLLGNYSVTLPGQFINAYVTSVASPDYNLTSTDYIVDAVYLHSANDFISYTNSSNTSTTDFNFSDYSSYSPVSILSSFGTVSAYGTFIYDAGQIFNFTYPNYKGTSAEFANAWIYFKASANSKHNFTIVFQSSSPVSAPNLTLYVRSANDNSFNSTYSFTFTQVGSADPSIYRYYCSTDFVLPTDQVYKLYLSGSYPSTISSPSYSLTVYKGTIADYMQYVQSQWNNISPSVTDLNQNTAQSVSDIGTAQTFESSAFTNFDTQLNSSGLDTFSLSFASTPLLWAAGLINTFYNNMPSTFQYLLMFVAFIGILVIIFNISGRVIRRFGGGD